MPQRASVPAFGLGMRFVDTKCMTLAHRSRLSVSAVLSLVLGGCLQGPSVQGLATATSTSAPSEAAAIRVADLATPIDEATADEESEPEPDAEPEVEASTTLLFADYGERRELVIERYRYDQMPAGLRVSHTDELLVASAPLAADAPRPERVWLHDRSGAVCPARVGALRVSVRQLAADIEQEEDQPQLSARDLVRRGKVDAASIWQTNAEDRLVTAKYTVESGHCEHPILARTVADQKDVFVASLRPVGAADRVAAKGKFAALGAYKRKEAAYTDYQNELNQPAQQAPELLVTDQLSGEYTYQYLVDAKGERRLWVSLSAGEACAPFSVRLSALYAWRGTELVLVRAYDEFDGANLEALIELQPGSDAAPHTSPGVELIQPAQRTRFWGEETVQSSGDSVEVPSHRCGC